MSSCMLYYSGIASIFPGGGGGTGGLVICGGASFPLSICVTLSMIFFVGAMGMCVCVCV